MTDETFEPSRALIAATRVAAAVAVALALLLSVPAFAGDFTEHDRTSHNFKAPQGDDVIARWLGDQPRQLAASEPTVMTDAGVASDGRGNDRRTTIWWRAPGNPQFGGR